MSMLILAVVMAILVEALVEYGKTILGAMESREYKTAVTQLLAIALAVALCVAVQADVFAALGIHFSAPWVGVLLTGIFASRGSNYMSDIIKKVQSAIGNA